jgi:3-dehydroquinate synthetase
MLEYIIDSENFQFKMELNYKKTVEICYTDIFKFINNTGKSKKIIFIDPVVLSHQDKFLDTERIDTNILLVPTNLHETNKDLESLKYILDILETHGVGRRGDIIFAIGGGALLDTVAFAASIFRRGISVIKVPTTLLGIVDASIGIKTGINYLGQRNRIGSYHFDYKVIIDATLMKGLHRNLVRQGLGEIFKIAVIKSKPLFDYLSLHKNKLENIDFYKTDEGLHILKTSILLMLEELHSNPREDNLMRCVDFGHSFSPLVEMESLKRSGIRSLPHGFSVAFDCLLTSTISMKRGLLSASDFEAIYALFLNFDFDMKNDIYLDSNLLWASYLEMTKHRGGNQNQPVPINIGTYSFIQDLTYSEMQLSLKYLQKLINQ